MPRTLDLGHRVIDLENGVVRVAAKELPLTNREREALVFLVSRAGEAVERDALLEEVWGIDEVVLTRAIDQAMVRLRKKIEPDPKHPQHLLTVHRVGYRLVLPEGAVASDVPNNLPAESDDFFGRVEALEAIDGLLAEGGLCTLKGPPGVGKTRLSRAFARGALERFPGGVWFCALETAHDRQALLAQVATALGMSGAGDADALSRTIGWSLAARGPTLVILDNLEQLPAGALAPISRWIAAAPEARFLASSRHLMDLPEEAVLEVAPLTGDTASALFADRASAVGVRLKGDEAALAQVVARLDGLPLAMELAAARLGQLSLDDLLRRLDRPLRIAASGAAAGANGPERQRTLRGAIAFSWELLSAAERDALARCAVFRGSFDAAGAEAVFPRFPDASGEVLDPLDLLAALERRSLIRSRRDEGQVRYALLESVRQFADEQLDALGIREHAEERLERWFVGRSPWPMPTGSQLQRGAWLRLLADHWTFKRVLERAIERSSPEVVGMLGVLYSNLSNHDGSVTEHIARWDRILDRTASLDDPMLRARLLDNRARLCMHSGRKAEGLRASEQAAALLGDDPAPLVACWVYESWSQMLKTSGEVDRAREMMERALGYARQAHCANKESSVLTWLAQLARLRGDIDKAYTLCQQALALGELAEVDAGAVQMELTPVCYARGDIEGAIAAARACCTIFRANKDEWSEVISVTNLGCMLGEAGRLGEAAEAFGRAVTFYRLRGDRRRLALALSNRSQCFVDDGQLAAAVEPLERALALYELLEVPMQCGRVNFMLGVVAHLQGDRPLASRRFDAAMGWFEGRGYARWEGLTACHRAAVRCMLGVPGEHFVEARAWIEAHPHPEAVAALDILEGFADVRERPARARERLDRVDPEALAKSSNLRHAHQLVELVLTAG